MSRISHRQLKPLLDDLYLSYTRAYERAPEKFFLTRRDPLMFARRYEKSADQEITGFLAATFAYGNVKSLSAFVENLLSIIGPSPSDFMLDNQGIPRLKRAAPYYRLQSTADIANLMGALQRLYRSAGSLENVYMSSYDANSTMFENLNRFVRRIHDFGEKPLHFLTPLPQSGSPCKRLNLFLRWMIRREGPDLHLWKNADPSRLIVPLDTHIGRIAYKLKWIKTPSLTWNKAETVTAVLKKYCPEDPVRYDFALCHESISRSPFLQRLTGR